MSLFRRFRAPKEVKAVLGVLDELEVAVGGKGYRLVRAKVEEGFRRFPDDLVRTVRGGVTPRQLVLQAVANTAGDLLESGRYHIHRGTLDPMGPGDDLLRVFDAATEELVRLGAADEAFVSAQKDGLRASIRQIG